MASDMNIARDGLPRLGGGRWELLRGLLGGRARRIGGGLFAAAAQSGVTLLMVPLVRIAFDQAIPRRDFGLLVAVGAGLAALRLASGVMMIIGRAQGVAVKTGIARDLRGELLRRLYQRPYVSHVRAETQPLATHIVFDADRVGSMADAILSGVAPAALMCAALGIALLLLNPLLVAVAALFTPLVWFASRFATRRIRANYRGYHDAQDRLMRAVRFVLDTFALTRSRGAEAAELERQAVPLDALRDAESHMAVDNVRAAQIQSMAMMLVGVTILVVGGAAVARHVMSLGALLAFFAAAGLASGQVDRLIANLPPLVEGIAALDRLLAHLRQAPPPPYDGARVIDWRGELTLVDVGFAYADTPVLGQVNLRLAPGGSAAIFGPNGAGKTTLLNLVLGFYRPAEGRLSADGVDYAELDMGALRRSIGLVPQHPLFFSASAFENIVYGAPGVTRADVEATAERLGVSRVLRGLPGGLDAPLGEGGLMLSGGQRQVIAILRALVVRPRLLILDEPTNHLDQATISGLIGAMRATAERPSLLLVSHDPELALEVDALYRLEAGRLCAVRSIAA